MSDESEPKRPPGSAASGGSAVERYIAEQTTANGANSGQTEEPADEKPTLTN